jgi:hypothetical protein
VKPATTWVLVLIVNLDFISIPQHHNVFRFAQPVSMGMLTQELAWYANRIVQVVLETIIHVQLALLASFC